MREPTTVFRFCGHGRQRKLCFAAVRLYREQKTHENLVLTRSNLPIGERLQVSNPDDGEGFRGTSTRFSPHSCLR
jgi:hypothetical protein